jgi:hypothetical protein
LKNLTPTQQFTEFGITWPWIKRSAIGGGILGSVFFILLVAAIATHREIHPHWLESLVLALAGSLALGAIVPGIVLALSVLRIRVVDGQLHKVLFGKWILASRSIEQLTALTLGGRLFPVVFRFEDGSRMRLVGIPIPEIFQLMHWLKENAPHCVIEE